MCDKAVDICSFVIDSVLDQYKTQEMCDKVVSKDPFMLKYCLDRYKTQEICDKAVDTFLPTLKFVPSWFVLSNMIKKHNDGLFSNDDIIFIHEDFNNVTFFSDEMGVLGVDFNTINLDDVNFREDNHEIIIYVRLMVWPNRFKQRKTFKEEISKTLMHVAWHHTRWWHWCKPEDKKKETEPPFIQEK